MHQKGHPRRQMKIAVRIADDQAAGGNGGFGQNRVAQANPVIGIAVVVGVRPPALGNGYGADGHILPVGQVQHTARRVMGGQPGRAAVVERNCAGGGSVFERQIQRCV